MFIANNSQSIGGCLNPATHTQTETIMMKQEEVEQCQIQIWYPNFCSVSISTHLHPLPEPFVSYLLEDGIFLPRSSQAMPARAHVACPDLQADDYHPWIEEEQDEDEPSVPSFPQLEAAIQSSIAKLGGAVFPKLNWSAPKDTAWISSSGSLKCRNFDEIVLLLKASDSLVHDLSHAFDSCHDKSIDRPETFVLAVRKWYDLRPEMEFRGFVRGGLLVGISQREVTGFYPVLIESEEVLESAIFKFFSDNLSERFGLENYTFDCYVTKDWRVKLIDFNPWGAFTLPLLFSWEELEVAYMRMSAEIDQLGNSEEQKDWGSLSGANQETGRARRSKDEVTSSSRTTGEEGPCSGGMTAMNVKIRELGYKAELRVVKSEGLVQPNLRLGGGVPFDYVNRGRGGAWDEFLRKADEELQQQIRGAAAGG